MTFKKLLPAIILAAILTAMLASCTAADRRELSDAYNDGRAQAQARWSAGQNTGGSGIGAALLAPALGIPVTNCYQTDFGMSCVTF